MLYCTAPGLAMWILDWGMRLYELRRVLEGTISSLAHFYIHHGDSSVRELHPFTTITHLASRNETSPTLEDEIFIQFLFRKRGKAPTGEYSSRAPQPLYRRPFRGKQKRMQSTQWTERFANLADELGSNIQSLSPGTSKLESGYAPLGEQGVNVSLRLEGPYFSPADPSRYNTVICVVAGTGISGAIAIAAAFNQLARKEQGHSIETGTPMTKSQWDRCIILWSVKATDDIELPFIEPMAHGLELIKFQTGPGRKRLDLAGELTKLMKDAGRTWVYISGPNSFIDAGEEACLGFRQREGVNLDFYGARWDI
ncbi:MAG: hypothetical protein Q9191_000573 [Dirinaria sp. TL-2023a]